VATTAKHESQVIAQGLLRNKHNHVIGIAIRRLLLCLAVLFATTCPARAQIESAIVIAGDPGRALCQITDVTPGLHTLYVVHAFNAGMVASRFKVQSGPGCTLTYVSEVHYFPSTIGNTQTGISVCYGQCTTGDQVIASIDYMGLGTSSSCSQMLIVPHPLAETVEAIKCSGVPTRTFVQDMFVGHNSGCGCPSAHGFAGTAQTFNCLPIAVAASTWGAIKALYRE